MANHPIEIEYNEELNPLAELLDGVERDGGFCVSGAVEIPMPKVVIDGVGVLSFPVPPVQVTALIDQATRAPYGRGAETILDESVRKVWQLAPDRVQISGKSWAASFDRILEQVRSGLGCVGLAVSAELYKLLVYDTGGFFLAHRDTEKTGGMFGTLVVVLPAAHHGGQVVVRHAGRENVVDMGGAEGSEVGFVAFYADCEHEVRPITDGHRICLVYNLVQQRGVKGAALLAPDYEKEIAAAAAVLEKNLAAPGAPAKIAWLLEHQYSPAGLAFAGLKSADAARAKVLRQAAERAGCVVHLGIVHIEESGAAQEVYDDHPRRGWGRYRDDDDEETDDASRDDFEVIEVCDWRHFVSQWRDVHDQPVEFGEIPIAPGELLPSGALDDEKPDAQRLLEASGNEGASFERSYHRAALVIWRRERYADVLLQAGVTAALPYLAQCIATALTGAASARREAQVLARRMVAHWQAVPKFGDLPADGPDQRAGMLRLLIQLGDAALLEEFTAAVVTHAYDGRENVALVAGVGLLGAERTGRLYAELLRRQIPLHPGPGVELLLDLTVKSKLGTDKAGAATWFQIATAAVETLDEIGKRRADNQWMDWRVPEKIRAVDALLVANLVNALGKRDAVALRATAVAKFAARPAVFDPVTVLVPALRMIEDWDAAANQLWEHSAAFLLDRSGDSPEAPADWRQNVKLACACADCRELEGFTHNPVERMHRFRIRQDRRQHLHQQIEKHSLDMTHVTERKGSPQTLVCTKDRRRYKRRCDQYRNDIAALAQLTELAEKSAGGNMSTMQRIAGARKLAQEWSPVVDA